MYCRTLFDVLWGAECPQTAKYIRKEDVLISAQQCVCRCGLDVRLVAVEDLKVACKQLDQQCHSTFHLNMARLRDVDRVNPHRAPLPSLLR